MLFLQPLRFCITNFPSMTHTAISEQPHPSAHNAKVPEFAEFACKVYPFLEIKNFHHVYYSLLQAFADNRIRRLIITMPPQHGKSVAATTPPITTYTK